MKSLSEQLDETARQIIERALAQTGYNYTRAAALLKLDRTNFYRRCRRLGIKLAQARLKNYGAILLAKMKRPDESGARAR